LQTTDGDGQAKTCELRLIDRLTGRKDVSRTSMPTLTDSLWCLCVYDAKQGSEGVSQGGINCPAAPLSK